MKKTFFSLIFLTCFTTLVYCENLDAMLNKYQKVSEIERLNLKEEIVRETAMRFIEHTVIPIVSYVFFANVDASIDDEAIIAFSYESSLGYILVLKNNSGKWTLLEKFRTGYIESIKFEDIFHKKNFGIVYRMVMRNPGFEEQSIGVIGWSGESVRLIWHGVTRKQDKTGANSVVEETEVKFLDVKPLLPKEILRKGIHKEYEFDKEKNSYSDKPWLLKEFQEIYRWDKENGKFVRVKNE